MNRAPGYVLEVARRPRSTPVASKLGWPRRATLLDRRSHAALDSLDAALGEWRGDAFAEFADAEWIRPEAIRLEELRLVATETRIDAELRSAATDEVVGRARRTARRPSAARAVRAPVDARAVPLRSAGRGAARRAAVPRHAARRARARTVAALRDLEAAILEERDELAWVAPAVPGADAPARTRRRRDALPVETHRARRARARPRARDPAARDRAASSRCSARAASARPGSRTGSRPPSRRSSPTVCASSSSRPSATRARSPPRSRDALDVQQRPNRSLDDSIVELLASQQLLLVLDNCEHVLDTTSELVELVLRWCPNVQVLATSREPLGIPAEVVWSVPPLPVPASRDEPLDELAEIPAVQLFVERARPREPDFVLDDANAAAVAEICIRLDGVPLALELAAARMRSMSPPQLAERLPERFRVLAGSRRATDPAPPHAARPRAVVATTCSTPTSSGCSSGSRCSRARSTSSAAERVCAGDGIDDARRRRAARRARRQVDAGRRARRARTATACWRRCASSAASGSPSVPSADDVRRARTPPCTSISPSRPASGSAGPTKRAGCASSTPAFDDVRDAHARRGRGGRRRLARCARRRRCASTRGGGSATSSSRGPTSPSPCPAPSDHPLYPVVLGVVAYGRLRARRARRRHRGRRARGRGRGARSATLDAGLAERAIGNARLLPRPRGRGDARGWIACSTRRSRSEAPSLVAHAYYMRSVAETSIGDRDARRGARGR